MRQVAVKCALVSPTGFEPVTFGCQRILDEERLFLIPGKALGMSDQLLRFGLGMSDFAQGLKRLDRFLRTLESASEEPL